MCGISGEQLCLAAFYSEMLVKFAVSQQRQAAAAQLTLDVSKLVKTVLCPRLSALD